MTVIVTVLGVSILVCPFAEPRYINYFSLEISCSGLALFSGNNTTFCKILVEFTVKSGDFSYRAVNTFCLCENTTLVEK